MLHLIKLENRIVLDGAAVGEAIEHAAGHEVHISTEKEFAPVYEADHHDVAGAAALLTGTESAAEPLDIILISDDLPDYQTIARAAKPGTEVIVYDADAESAQDVIGRVAAVAEAEGKAVDSLTVFSHGGAGYFELGNEAVKADNLESNAGAWAALDAAMKDDGHIYIYGCSVAKGEGLSLPDSLAAATRTRVFASDDMTGGTGDWDLETASENTRNESPAPPLHFDMLADYEGSLTKIAVPTAISSMEDQPGLFGIYIYGSGEDAGSRTEGSVTRTGSLPSILTDATLRYDGWITNQPITIEGQEVTQYHRWSVTYTPDQDAFSDDGTHGSDAMLNFRIAEENQTFNTNVTVLAVNDAPDFEYSDADERVSIEDGTVTVTVDEDSGNNGFHQISNFADDIIAGPENESSQKVKFIIDSVTVEMNGEETDSSDLFDVLPSIAPLNFTSLNAASGNLTFTLKDNAFGTAEVSVRVQDDGGTAFGGDDTSIVKKFIIKVNDVNDRPDTPDANQLHIYEENGLPDDYDPTPEAQVEGFTVDQFIKPMTDPDIEGNIPIAIAITDIDTDMDGDGDSDGKWQFQMSGSDDWTTIEKNSLNGDDALLLTADDKIRFIPNENFNSEEPDSAKEPSFTVRAWDQTGDSEGKEGSYYSIGSNDTAFSAESKVVSLEVKAVNDAPELWKDDALMPDTVGPYKANNGTVVITGISAKDDDIARGEGDKRVQITLEAEQDAGKISLGSTQGLSFTTGDGTEDHKMVFTGLRSDVNTAIASLTYKFDGQVTQPLQSDTVTIEVNDLKNYGVPEAKTDTARILIDLNRGPGVGEVDGIFIEDCAPVPVAGNITDAEGDEIRSVTINFKENTYKTGEDVLHYSTAAAANILADYNSQTGQLKLTVKDGETASAEDFQKVLDTVKYENTSENPNTVQRKFEIVSVDEHGNSGTSESVVSVVPVNDAPDLDNVPGSITVISDTSTTIDNISLADVDIAEGNVNIVIESGHGTLAIGQEVINRIVTGGGSVEGNGTLKLTIKDATLADIAPSGILAALTYTPETDYNGGDTIHFTINDQGYTGVHPTDHVNNCRLSGDIQLTPNGQLPDFPNEGTPGDPTAQTDTAVINITVRPPNTGPVIDLDPDDDGGDGPDDGTNPDNPGHRPNFEVAYVEGCDLPNGVKIADTDATVTDPDEGDLIASMTVTLTNPRAYDLLTANTDGTSIQMTEYNPATGVLTLQGEAGAADYQQVLRTITFFNTSENPDMTPRVIHIVARDNFGDTGNESTLVHSTVHVIPVNDAPEASFPVDIGTTQNTAVILSGISVSDKDIELSGGTVQVVISSSENGKLEITHFDSGAAVTGDGTDELVIEGTLADVNEALTDIKYTPYEDFNGNDNLTIVANDMGYSGIGRINGIESSVPEFCSTTRPGQITIAELERLADEADNTEGSKNPETNRPDSPHALEDRETIVIQVAKPGPPPVEPPPQPPTPPLPPITTPEGGLQHAINLGAVRLPGAFGMIEGAGRPSMSARSGGEDFFDFCSLEEALRPHLGCRFANTRDPEAQFNAISWNDLTDLGWTEPYLDEEYDLYTRLFLREAGDPGFNMPSGALEVELGGQTLQKPAVFSEAPAEDFNDIGPLELKKAFFNGREHLDRTGRGPDPKPVQM